MFFSKKKTYEAQKKNDPVRPPRTCLLTVTNQCVLHCRMCHLWRLDTAGQEISIDDGKQFVRSLGGFAGDPVEVHLIGGEPLIKEGIFDLIRCIRQGRGRTVMTSCGYPITPGAARDIVDSGLSMLNFSLESLDPEVHDYLRGQKDCFGRVCKAISYFEPMRSQSPRLAINTIITALNMKDLPRLARWVREHPMLESIYFMALMRPFGSSYDWQWYKNSPARELWPQDTSEVCGVLDELIDLKKDGCRIENSLGQLNMFKSYFRDPDRFVKMHRCNLSDEAVNVNALGDIYLCFFMEKLGNIRTDNIVDLWYSQKARQIRHKMRQCRQNCELVVNCYYED